LLDEIKKDRSELRSERQIQVTIKSHDKKSWEEVNFLKKMFDDDTTGIYEYHPAVKISKGEKRWISK